MAKTTSKPAAKPRRAPEPPPAPAVKVGELLRAHLADRGIPQARAAVAAGVPQQTVNDIVNGRKDATLSTLMKVLGGLGLSLRWLHEHGVRPPEPPRLDPSEAPGAR